MATTERYNTSSSCDERRPSHTRDKPLFTQRNKPRKDIREFRRNSSARKEALAKEEEERAVGTVGAAPRTGGWMASSRGSGLGLGEAFQRTDDKGVFIPRARPTVVEPEGTVSESRVPRMRTFSPDSAKGALSPRHVDRDAYISKGREGRTLSEPVFNYESEDTGVGRQTSPSPAPRVRRRAERGSGSDTSSMSQAESPTIDKPSQEMTRAQKDAAFVQRRLNGPPLFLKRSGAGPRIADTTKTLERKTSANSLDDEPDPPYNIPKTWGSKATKNRAWMDKILYGSSNTSLEVKDPLEDPASSERPRTTSDLPLPSIENRASIQEPTPPSSRPASAQPMNASPENSKMWDADLDFTAQSLQISTSPKLRVRSSKIDELRSREIQNLTARAVATNRLEEIRERNSEERSFNTEYAAPEEEPVRAERSLGSEPARMSTKNTERKAEPVQEENEYHEKTILEEEGEKIPFSPITVFRAKDFDDYVKRNNITFSRSNSSSSASSRPGSKHKRDESHELLRRLSRSMSTSPAPPRLEEADKRAEAVSESKAGKSATHQRIETPEDPIEQKSATEKGIVQNRKVPIVEPKLATKTQMPEPPKANVKLNPASQNPTPEPVVLTVQQNSSDGKSDVDPEERITAEAKLFELLDNKSEKDSGRSSDDEQFSFPTPKITGAYIETPMTIRTKPPQPQPQPRSRRPLINTAKHVSAAEDLRRIQRKAQVEDSTLDDFDAVLEAEAAAAAAEGQNINNNTTIIKPVLDLEYNERGLPLSKSEVERRIERLTLDRMNKSLKATSTSIRDARHGIERLEEQVSSSSSFMPSTRTTTSSPSNKENSIIYIPLTLPLPRLYVLQPPHTPRLTRGWKPTRLGLLLFLLLTWFILETAMCARFCHQRDSRTNSWRPEDPFFPYAIPTKLDQWTGEVVSSGLGSVARTFGICVEENCNWGLFPTLPEGYKGGPIGSSDWWLGRDGPVGIAVEDGRDESFGDDEML